MQLMTTRAPLESKPSSRLHLLDEVRGACILYVLFYHFMYDLDTLFGIIDFPYLWSDTMQFLRMGFVILLMLLSGISCTLSKNNFRRALKLLCAALFISLITYWVVGSDYVLFGILHFFSFAIFVYCLTGKYLKKLPTKTFSLLFGVLFLMTFDIYNGSLSLLEWELSLPSFLYNKFWLVPFGFGMEGFSSIDYYPVFPWIFIFLIGALYGEWLRTHRVPTLFHTVHLPFLSTIGRHTLFLYLVHQPIFYVLIGLFTFIK